MKIQVTEDEIKKSHEFRWFKHRIKMNAIRSGIIGGIFLILPLIAFFDIGSAEVEKSQFLNAIIPLVALFIFCVLYIMSVFLYYKSKMNYLKKNYTHMKAYVTRFDSFLTSYMFRQSIYYEVTLKDENKNVVGKYQTSPMFSSSFFSACSLEEVNNEYMVVLFDEKKEKVYVIRKAKNEEIL